MKPRVYILRRRIERMPIAALALTLLVLPACRGEAPLTPNSGTPAVSAEAPGGIPAVPADKITGSVEIVFRGGNGNDPGEADGEKKAFVDIEAHETTPTQPGHGSFTYTVTDLSGNMHRQIVVELQGTRTDPISAKAWYVGHVVSDTKGCSGGGTGGHEPGCPGGDCGDDHGHLPGGCSGSDGGCDADHDHVDGGCSGSDGGCDTDHDHVDGGCSGTDGSCGSDHDHVDGGCSGSDGHDGGHDGGCSGGGGSCGGHSGSSGGSARVNGRSCRVGQALAGKAHDGGTPAVGVDGITWKWFDADDPALPSLDDIATWPHLCGKTITGGNLVVHVARDRDDRIMIR